MVVVALRNGLCRRNTLGKIKILSPLLLLAKRVCTSSTVLACILRAYAVVYLKFIKNIILYCSLMFIELSLNIYSDV